MKLDFDSSTICFSLLSFASLYFQPFFFLNNKHVIDLIRVELRKQHFLFPCIYTQTHKLTDKPQI